jgi:lipopolysaccharide export system permease protein
VPWSILHRYVLFELIRVFVLALAAITGILVMAGVVQEASQQGLGPAQILKLIPLLIPGTLPYTVPATTLFAVSVVYGRLAHDNEITAIKSAGIPVTRIVWPAVLVGLLASGGVFVLYREFIPGMHHRLRSVAIKDIEELIYARLRKDLTFNEPRVNYAIWVREVQGRRLIWPIFIRRDSQGRDEIIAMAREAEIKIDLARGNIDVHMLHGEMSKDGGATRVIFAKEVVPVPLPPLGAAARRIRPREMSDEQLLRRRQLLLERLAELRAHGPAPRTEAAGPAAARAPADPFTYISPDVPAEYLQKEVWELETEYALRPALSFGCLFFVLIGCPVGIWFHKRDYLSAFVTCFLPIVVSYYPLLMFGINLSKEGQVEPNRAMWIGNGVLGLTGLTLLYRLTRR